MEHSIGLVNVENARDLGGYSIGGKAVRSGLLRTGDLSGASKEDLNWLETIYSPAVVVDFRMSVEREQRPDPEIAGAENHFLPVLEPEDMPGYDPSMLDLFIGPAADRAALMRQAVQLGVLSDRIYVDFLLSERGKAAYRGFFRLLLDLPEGRGILWHCTDGKDRTGLASMLLLTALGAEEKTVMEDYLLTNAFNAEKLTAARAGLGRSSMATELREMALFGMGAVFEHYMLNALSALREGYGSAEGYLERELGIGAAERAHLRQRFLR